MYDDYDFNEEDDFQRLIEGKCSDDEEYFNEHKKRSEQPKKSTQSNKSQSKKSSNSITSSKRKRGDHLFLEDENSNSNDLKDDDYDKYDKYDEYDDYGDDDPVNPFEEAEEEPVRKAKDQSAAAKEEGDDKLKRKNIIRNPRVLLNEEKLKSSDGVIKLPELFKDIQFNGKNHEKEDLNRIIGIYQNWSHRLMPSLQFDDFIERSENLCKKGKMKVFLTKIRNNLPLDIRDKPAEEQDNNETVNQYDDSQDEQIIGDKPDLVPKTMDDEFMDDDFNMENLNDEDFNMANENEDKNEKVVESKSNEDVSMNNLNGKEEEKLEENKTKDDKASQDVEKNELIDNENKDYEVTNSNKVLNTENKLEDKLVDETTNLVHETELEEDKELKDND